VQSTSGRLAYSSRLWPGKRVV